MINQSVTVVIRSVDERTAIGCEYLLRQIFPEESIWVINEAPLSKAITKMFEIGLREKDDWLLCIDADVLITAEGVKQLFAYAVSSNAEAFQIQGLVLDKFFSIYRPAGNHLYRMSYARQAISFIPQEGISLRPETDMLNKMAESGYPWVQCDAIVGIHDYEQYYVDIYRKCFLQAHKHKWLMPQLVEYWTKMASSDFDFNVALWGLNAGMKHSDTVYIDKRFMEKEAKEMLHSNQVTEKSKIEIPDKLKEYVQLVLDIYHKENFAIYQDEIFPHKLWNRTIDIKTIKKSYDRNLKGRIFSVIKHIGTRLKSKWIPFLGK